jgi:hypothetical protein
LEFQLTRQQSTLGGQWLLPEPQGETICFEEPLTAQILPLMMRALQESDWPYQFHGLYYRLRTNSKLIEESVPASEHYKISWMAMSQKHHGALFALEALESNARELSETYQAKRLFVGDKSQPKLLFQRELYRLRSDFSTLLFLIRSNLDQFAALIQFLSGPTANQFSSFADVITKAARDNPPPEIPDALLQHLRSHSTWFWRMRDIRDYIAHHGFVRLSLVQSPDQHLRFFVHQRLDLLDLASEFMQGYQLLLSTIDQSFAARIRNPSQ